MNPKHEYRKPGRRVQRTPSFVTVPPGEEEDSLSLFTIMTNMGIPVMYLITGAFMITGIICMSIITKYWAAMNPPQCFLYSSTPSSFSSGDYVFGTNLSSCNWVAYGGIPSLLVVIVCGILYTFHVKDDKDLDIWSVGVVVAMLLATVMLLAVACTLAQGIRITCASVSLNNNNNRGSSCKDKIDLRAESYKLSVQTSSMITATSISLWGAVASMFIICAFHIALVIRRRAREYDHY